ncbi:hypothetical protein [Bosea sp. TAF32]|uniref:hypothetical protein n=1 Tax=Bosea sp. TAF32 TaxID=3237482 RepID=UPI003F921052
MNIDLSYANVVATLALAASAVSGYVGWMNRRDTSRLSEPLLWLTAERFDTHREWRWVYVNVSNRSADWVRLVSASPRGGTKVHGFDGPIIGGEFWQFPDRVNESGFVASLDLDKQNASAEPGATTVAQFLAKSSAGRIQISVTMRIAAPTPKMKTVRLQTSIKPT